MRLIKKVLAATLVSAMAFSMSACSSQPAETTAAKEEVTTAAESKAESVAEEAKESTGKKDLSEVKVGISIYKFDDNFMTLYRQELERYLI